MFTSDHLAWSPARNLLTAFRSAEYSWAEQTRTMTKLFDYGFEWVPPGHGCLAHRPKAEVKGHLIDCIKWMKQQ